MGYKSVADSSCPFVDIRYKEGDARRHCHNEWAPIDPIHCVQGLTKWPDHMERNWKIPWNGLLCHAKESMDWWGRHDVLDWEVSFAKERHTSSPCYATPHLGLVSCPHDGTSGKKIQSIGIEVQYITGGCTYVCQPIDVGANKPLKSKMADLWEECVDTENMKDVAEIPTPPREWLRVGLSNAIGCWTIKNVRMHGKRRDSNGYLTKIRIIVVSLICS